MCLQSSLGGSFKCKPHCELPEPSELWCPFQTERNWGWLSLASPLLSSPEPASNQKQQLWTHLCCLCLVQAAQSICWNYFCWWMVSLLATGEWAPLLAPGPQKRVEELWDCVLTFQQTHVPGNTSQAANVKQATGSPAFFITPRFFRLNPESSPASAIIPGTALPCWALGMVQPAHSDPLSCHQLHHRGDQCRTAHPHCPVSLNIPR